MYYINYIGLSGERSLPFGLLVYSKTGVYRGIQYFLSFALKLRSWVLVRTASTSRFSSVPMIYVLR